MNLTTCVDVTRMICDGFCDDVNQSASDVVWLMTNVTTNLVLFLFCTPSLLPPGLQLLHKMAVRNHHLPVALVDVLVVYLNV